MALSNGSTSSNGNSQNGKNRGSGSADLLKFAVLVGGLIVVAYLLMNAASWVWPE
jgi:hypothetical protein